MIYVASVLINIALLWFLTTRKYYHETYDILIFLIAIFIPIIGTIVLLTSITGYYSHEKSPSTIAYRKQHNEWANKVAAKEIERTEKEFRHSRGIYTEKEKKDKAEEKRINARWNRALSDTLKTWEKK